MKYMLLLFEAESLWQSKTEDERNAELGEYMGLDETFAGKILAGDALQPTMTATTVRVREGKTLTTDGPFAETREQLGGYYLVDAENLDEAIRIAEKIPAARGGSVEIRPVMIFE